MNNNMSSLNPGTLLQGGKYRIVRFINSGGFGCTYEAEHVMLENRVAIKEFFVKDFCNRDETTSHVTVGTLSKKGLVHKLLRKFVDEARAICKLHHPGIVSVSDIFEENGTAYFVMDYIEGRSLSQMVKAEGPLPEARALRYIRQVADALGYVHAHNRLHLDVKPGNVMVDASDRAILIDFGASKQYDEQDGENTSTLMGKTPGYAPLEQMGNDVVRFMPATDIYSLGATLYKLLTGITPLSANLLASGEELSPLPDAVSASTRQAIAAAMQTNKNKRPQSIGEFLALLGMGEEPIKKEIEDDEDTLPEDDEDTLPEVEEPKPAPAPKPQPAPRPAPAPTPKPKVSNVRKRKSSSRKKWGILLAVTVIAALVWMGWPREVSQVAISSPSGTISGHDYVDLGLSVKWATCNVGASSPTDYGTYFAWGETKSKSSYIEENSETCWKSFDDISGDSRYDAARADWGSSWRMPTKAECQELVDKCKWTWTTQSGHNGYIVVGPNGNSIFLPAAGFRQVTSLDGVGERCGYWSSTPDKDRSQHAYQLEFTYSGYLKVDWNCRRYGHNVRPVLVDSSDLSVSDSTAHYALGQEEAPAPSLLYVTTSPSGATVYVDGKKVGTTPIDGKEIERGSHMVKISKSGYETLSEKKTFGDKPVVLNETLVAEAKKETPVSSGSSRTAKKTFTVNGVTFTMVSVKGGTFRMGATSEQQSPDSDEKPVHSVTLSDYYIGETEVTQALWRAVMVSNPSYSIVDNLPVEQVSWNDCQTFIRKLNQLTGATFRLPTEAEWEYAARGGNKSRGYQYSGSNNLGDVAWYGDNSGLEPHVVKTKQPNELGLYDMSGNVWEWCQDCYGDYTSSAQTNPTGPSSGSFRVLRGGGWSSNAWYCRVSIRGGDTPDFSIPYLGLRLFFQDSSHKY